MANYKVTDTQLSGIADAIRSVTGTSDPIVFPSGFVSAVQDIPSPSGSIGISANGTYNVMSYASAVVDVPVPSGSISISQNGTFDVSSFASAVVNVEGGSAVLESLTVSQNGHYTPSTGVDGFNDVVVNVSGGGGGSNDNFKIAVGDMSGSIYDTEVSNVGSFAFISRNSNTGKALTGVEMTAVVAIGNSAFAYCSSLTTASFPSCTSIGVYAFLSCINLVDVNLPSCANVLEGAFRNCHRLTAISLPLCTFIGSSAFSSCSRLTVANLSLCKKIDAGAFMSCSSLAAVNLTACESIASSAFYECRALSEIFLPKCSFIGFNAFNWCASLARVVLLSASVVSLVSTATFNNTPMQKSSFIGDFGSIYVPTSLVDAYKSAANWSAFSDRITAYTE